MTIAQVQRSSLTDGSHVWAVRVITDGPLVDFPMEDEGHARDLAQFINEHVVSTPEVTL